MIVKAVGMVTGELTGVCFGLSGIRGERFAKVIRKDWILELRRG
jgi:hypothetical protein